MKFLQYFIFLYFDAFTFERWLLCCKQVGDSFMITSENFDKFIVYKSDLANSFLYAHCTDSAFFISCFLIARSIVSRALRQCTDHSHCFSTSFSLFKSSGLAICSFMPVFFASCTSSAKAFAVMAMMGTLPRLPASARIAAVAS